MSAPKPLAPFKSLEAESFKLKMEQPERQATSQTAQGDAQEPYARIKPPNITDKS